MISDSLRRVVVEGVLPQVDCGRFPIKRALGETVAVTADIHADGHDALAAVTMYRRAGEDAWREVPMEATGNDRWQAGFKVDALGEYRVHRRRLDRQVWQLAVRALEEVRRRPGRRQRAPRGGRAHPRDGGAAADDARGRGSAARRFGTEGGHLSRGPGGHARGDRHAPGRARGAGLVGGAPPADGGAPGSQPGDPLRPRARRHRRARAGARRRVVRDVSAVGGHRPLAQRHVRRGGRAAALRGGDGIRRPLPAADPSDRPQLPQGAQQFADARPERSGQPLGDRIGRGRAHGGGTGARHDRGFRSLRRGGAAAGPRDRARHRATRPRRITPTSASIPSGSATGRTARSSTPRTRRRSTRTSIRFTSNRRTGKRSGTS